MTRDALFDILKQNILDVLPDLDPARISEDKSLQDLGANSIDRADVITQTMEQVGVKFQISELAGLKNIRGLLDFLAAKTRDDR